MLRVSVFHEPLLFPEEHNSLGSHDIMKCSVTILMSWILFTISAKMGPLWNFYIHHLEAITLAETLRKFISLN